MQNFHVNLHERNSVPVSSRHYRAFNRTIAHAAYSVRYMFGYMATQLLDGS